MFKIIIVEDDITVRRELETLMKNALYHPVSIEAFENTAQQIVDIGADLVLLDVDVPGEDGLAIITALRQKSDVPVIFVTGKSTSMDELAGITAGGDDYITKPYQAPVLLARIAAVLKRSHGRQQKEAAVIIHKQVSLNLFSCTLTYEGREADLSKNEFRILSYLFQHPGQVVSRIDLIEFLWDNQVFIDDNTLSVNMTRIRSKLADLGVQNLIETKRGLGYKI